MARTLLEYRNWLRAEIGDLVRVSGTVDSGTVTTIVDAAALTQADDYWNDLVVNIETSTDGEAPQGESKEILDFTASSDTLTTEPFSAAPEAGDLYTIAFFSNAQLTRYINEAIRDISKLRPYQTTASLAVTDGAKRYDVPANARRIEAIRYINTATEEEISYDFHVESHTDKIVFPYYWSESKTLTVYYTKDHTALSADSDTTTIDEDYEIAVLLFAQAQAVMAMRSIPYEAAQELQPIDYAEGQVEISGGTVQKALRDQYEDLLKRYSAALELTSQAAMTYSISHDADVDMGETKEYLRG